MASLVSFPRTIENNENNSSIYNKVVAAASQMLQTFRSEESAKPSDENACESDDQPNTHLSNFEASQLALPEQSTVLIHNNSNQSLANNSSTMPQLQSQSNAKSSLITARMNSVHEPYLNSIKNQTPISKSFCDREDTDNKLRWPLISKQSNTKLQYSSLSNTSNLSKPARPEINRAYPPGPECTPSAESSISQALHTPDIDRRSSLASTDSSFSTHPIRPNLLRSSATSRAIVGISDAQAVPLLQTSETVPIEYTYNDSYNQGKHHNISLNSSDTTHRDINNSIGGVDVESMFSINTASASRAYLASHYSRSQSKVAPGKLNRELWMKDENATSCFSCNRVFTTFRRKHHCRVCGQIFCSACTSLIDGGIGGSYGRRLRCCRSCEDALVSHSSSDDDADNFLNQAPEDSFGKWPEIIPAEYQRNDIGHYKSMTPVSAESSSNQDDNNVNNTNGVGDLRNESYSRLASPVISDDLHVARSFLGVGHHHSRPRSRSYSSLSRDNDDNTITTVNNNTWIGNYGTIYGSGVGTLPNSTIPVASGTLNSQNFAHLTYNDNFPLSTARFPNSSTVELNNATLMYLSLFLVQLLKDSELDPDEWKAAIIAIILDLAAGIHLEINDRISPREWIKIKRIPGGSAHDVDCINGCVISHTLARKSMPRKIQVPRILILTFPIEYARNERYMSLEPVVAQEKEYLRKLIARIIALRPSLLLTSSHVCGQAMSMLEGAGISVAQKVRESALIRVGRITKADILTSIDRLSAHPQLGSCESFEQKSYKDKETVKTFFFFTVKPSDPGRCAIVRGESEISGIIKVVLEVMAEICYSLKAETALIRDQFAMVPNLNETPIEIMSSSPFVNYGAPFLQSQTKKFEQLMVDLTIDLKSEKDRNKKYVLTQKLEFVESKWLEFSKNWSSLENSYPFMFNPSSHQNIIVLYSLVCAETTTPCIGPDPQLIEFYLNTDQTLGKFVESSIEQVHDHCPEECGRSLNSHYRTYVNGNGMVTVKIDDIRCKVPGLENSILMWSYCKICEQQMSIVPMSSTTWKYSMGKYLELSFYGEPLKMRASSCPHNVYRDHIRYFGWHDHAVVIEYSTIELYEIYPPPKRLRWNPNSEIETKSKVFKEWNVKLRKFWTSLRESLNNVKVEGLEDSMIELSQQRLEELKLKAESDFNTSTMTLEQINNDSEPYDYLSLNKILEEYQRMVNQWHSDLTDFDGQFFPTEGDIRRVTDQHIRGLLGEDPETPKHSRRNSYQSSKSLHDYNTQEKSGSQEDSNYRPALPLLPVLNDDEGVCSKVDSHSKSAEMSQQTESCSTVQQLDKSYSQESPYKKGLKFKSLPDSNTKFSPSAVKVKSRSGNDINLSIPDLSQTNMKMGKNRVSILAEHFEELSREFERERIKEKCRLRERQRAIRQRHAHPVAEVFEDVTEAIEDWPFQQNATAGIRGCNLDVENHRSPTKVPLDGPFSNTHAEPIQTENGFSKPELDDTDVIGGVDYQNSDDENETKSVSTSRNDGLISSDTASTNENEEDYRRVEPVKSSLIRTLVNFWAERSSTRWNGIEYMLHPQEHFFVNSLVIIRESEPSSLIAFCLSLPDYNNRVSEFYTNSTTNSSQITTDGDSVDSVLEQAMLRRTGTHMRYHFDRNNVKISCKIFFSEQFESLRRKCGVNNKFIQSLSRCNTWESTGGKSGSAFLKTLDDRLILKELSHGEFDSFVNFAPSYFEYISQALFHDLPTVLSKIFGVYQITIKNTQTSLQVKMYVLVMENLFYGSRFSKVFDLKGSMRNRKVTETGKEDQVLLDENMVEYIFDSPVFVRDHSKRMLRASLYNDTLFLTKMNVMDYSLIIGLDDENKVIFAGIIDYIRTYTWDKKIESWVKTKTATVGVKEPTVVSPKQYKGRFRESMERYFVMVPDCWSQPSFA